MSTTEQIISLFEGLSFAEKLSLNERLASAMRKEGGGQTATPQKKRGPKAKADGEPKPKRKAAIGTLAWMAYVKHIKETRPEALEGLSKESEKLTLIKGIRADEPEAYNTFVAEWKDSHKEDAASVISSAEEVESEEESASVSASAPAPAAPAAAASPAPAAKALSAAEKIAAIKSSNAKVGGASTPVKNAAAPAAAAAAAPGAPKKPVKKVTVKEDATMPVKEIDGVSYWHHPASNKLWEKTGDDTVNGTGPFVGFFQPGNKEEPIRYDGEFDE
jgi:hypothetical protein